MSKKNLSFAHLDPKIRVLAASDAEMRIRTIEKDLFIEHYYSRHLTALLVEMMSGPRQIRMPCLLIAGDAGMGKTAQLDKFQQQYPDAVDPETGVLTRPVLIVNVPPEPSRLTLTFAILDALQAPLMSYRRTVDRTGVIRRMLASQRTRVVVFDEVQHVCHSPSRDRRVVLDSIKPVSTVNQVNVICAGTLGVEREFRADAQLERRFEVTQFPSWKNGIAFKRFLDTFERIRPLRPRSHLTEEAQTRSILEETGGITHRIVQRINAAAIVAVHEGIERITPDLVDIQRTNPARVYAARQAASANLAPTILEPLAGGRLGRGPSGNALLAGAL